MSAYSKDAVDKKNFKTMSEAKQKPRYRIEYLSDVEVSQRFAFHINHVNFGCTLARFFKIHKGKYKHATRKYQFITKIN